MWSVFCCSQELQKDFLLQLAFYLGYSKPRFQPMVCPMLSSRNPNHWLPFSRGTNLSNLERAVPPQGRKSLSISQETGFLFSSSLQVLTSTEKQPFSSCNTSTDLMPSFPLSELPLSLRGQTTSSLGRCYPFPQPHPTFFEIIIHQPVAPRSPRYGGPTASFIRIPETEFTKDCLLFLI